MSPLGPIYLSDPRGASAAPLSQSLLDKVEEAVNDIINTQLAKACEVVTASQDSIGRLVELLLVNREQVLPTQTIIDRVWPDGGDKAMLKQLIYRLSHKIEGTDVYIDAVLGVGYSFMRKW